jgi:hypothetical protein
MYVATPVLTLWGLSLTSARGENKRVTGPPCSEEAAVRLAMDL